MADGVAITAGSGTTIATDDAGASGHVQIVKLARSTDGSATPLTADADGLLVNLGTNNDVTVTGTVTATGAALESGGNLAAAATSLAIIDDWDETDRAKVNPIVGQAGVAAGAGAVSATVQRVTLASDDPAVALLGTIDADTGGILTAVQLIDNAISGSEMQVDVVAALPAGTNNIGDVDVLTMPAVAIAKSGMATAVSLASAATSAQVVAANTDRLGLCLTNTDANRCYINLGAAASATAFVVYLDTGDYWELPTPCYTGAVNAIWSADGSGSLIGMELD